MGYWERYKIAGLAAIKLLAPLIGQFLKDNGPAILQIALKVIFIIATSTAAAPKPDEEKRKQAFRMVKEEANRRGIDASDFMVNAAIEIAVAKSKEKKEEE